MKDLLNNPKTTDYAHVMRALDIRQINNVGDINFMFILLVLAMLLFFGLFGFITYKYKPWFIAMCVVSVVMFIVTIKSYVELTDKAVTAPTLDMSTLKLFYLLDGIIIILSYAYNLSYEMFNIILFSIVFPLLILSLSILVIRLQAKLSKYEQQANNQPQKTKTQSDLINLRSNHI